MKIERRNYSGKPWRLINDGGGMVFATERFQHPQLGQILIESPIGGETRRECEERTLALLSSMLVWNAARMKRLDIDAEIREFSVFEVVDRDGGGWRIKLGAGDDDPWIDVDQAAFPVPPEVGDIATVRLPKLLDLGTPVRQTIIARKCPRLNARPHAERSDSVQADVGHSGSGDE